LPKPIDETKLIEKAEFLLKEKDNIISRQRPVENPNAAFRELARLSVDNAVLEDDIKKLISPGVYEKLKSEPESLMLRYYEVAVGFVDIRGFSKIMNSLDMDRLNEVLEMFFELTSEFIINEGGFIDKFMGDSVMWFHHEDSIDKISNNCLKVAVDIMKAKESLEKRIEKKLYFNLPIRLAIGAACGRAAVGILGTSKYRIQYSVLGSPVNLASRLCSRAKRDEIIIGGRIINYCNYASEVIGPARIKGFDHKIELRRVIIPKLSGQNEN
jgi:adenylate cyclase